MTQRIVIVGGGFCGTVLAINLLRGQSPQKDLEIVLINRTPDTGPGLAYATRNWPYVLNVPAGRLSTDSREPLQFLHFVQATLPTADAEDFLPRSMYGNYLQHCLKVAEQQAPSRVRLIRIVGDVRGISRGAQEPFTLDVQGLPSIRAHQVVLALGNPPPSLLPGERDIANHPAFEPDPWGVSRTLTAQQTVLIVGSGLTMADVAVSVARNDKNLPRIVSISRHGLLPHTQTVFRPLQSNKMSPALAQAKTVRQLMRVARMFAQEWAEQGGDWREIVTAIRNAAPALWNQLTLIERRRFLRHAQSYWDVHRHRLPPQMASRLAALQGEGALTVQAGRILSLTPVGQQINVQWQGRGATGTHTVLADMVVNATGPNYSLSQSREQLVQSLRDTGLLREDPLSLGIDANTELECLGADGRSTEGLYYLGPMLRARYWEATAATELRDHAEKLAPRLLSRVAY